MVFATNFTMIRSSLNALDYSTGPPAVPIDEQDVRHSSKRLAPRRACRRAATLASARMV
jgi:hypothetical protein